MKSPLRRVLGQAMTLGDLLVKSGIVSQKQFEEALKNRVIYGGRVGTSLLELGYIGEEALAKALSHQLSVPYVDPSVLLTIPADVTSLISKEIAEKYKVIPLSLERRKLSLVMADPTDLVAIDDIAFITGFNIEPVIAPEIRLMQALEKYYQLELDPRYLPIIKKMEERKAKATVHPPVESPVSPRPAKQPAEAARKPESVQPKPTPPSEQQKQSPLDALSDRIAEAQDREEIADLLMKYVGAEFHRGALFLVREGMATGWRAVMMKMVLAGFERFQIGFEEPSVLKVVAEGSSYYLGPVPDTAANARILKAMGGGKPSTILLLPLVILGRVVNILYVEGKGSELRDRLPDLQKMLAKTSMAFEILILKNKIKMW